jgi:hypothetical protein
MHIRHLFIGIAIFLLIPATAFCSPSISGVSGTLKKGNTVEVNGGSFGSKSTAKPWTFDDHDHGSIGATVSSVESSLCSNSGSWSTSGSPVYSNANLRSGNSTRSVKHKYDDNNGTFGSKYYKSLNGASSFYYSVWMWINETSAPNPTSNRNVKLMRVYGGDGAQILYVSFDNSWYNHYDSKTNYVDGGWSALPKSRWIRLEITADTHSGSTMRLSDPTGKKVITNTVSSGGGSFYQVITGDYARRSSGGNYTWYTDDVYIDTTQARVELGDASTWSGSVHREIQIPTSWQSNKISFVFNPGSFNGGNTAYLYVVDSNGNVNSNGYRVTVGNSGSTGSGGGGSGDETPPPAPGNLHVVSAD